ncbi:MAG: DUF2357 domain-containing protein [Bacteroidales bacterium]|nr:DUF2357 domain-containing protein [Bacteroidales bacterium]
MSEINIQLNNCTLKLFCEPNFFKEVDDAEENGEARYQLFEGKEYEYYLEEGFHFDKNPIIKESNIKNNEGRIITGNFVGTLELLICDKDNLFCDTISFEIQSSKTSYRSDYRKMLNDITNYYTELVMLAGSPVTQKFEPTDQDDQRTLYQKFAFVKSIIESEEFEEAINKILYNPVKKWTETIDNKSICSVKRLGRNELRQITSSKNRIKLPNEKSIAGMNSIPKIIQIKSKEDTIDTPENRFIKYVLQTFHSFCDYIHSLSNENARLELESRNCCNKLEEFLCHSFFKQVKQAQFVALNSPILQKKEGYREVLQAWTIFDLASKLTWKGGDNVYNAGNKNIATLYEYWLFFKLLELISELFSINPKDKSNLVKKDDNGINLNIKQGRQIMVGGVYKTPTRNINVRFFYNRTFTHNTDINTRGSWSLPMRPDYTLSIWPGDVSEEEAEKQNIIVHIHFDAKYRVNKIYFQETENEEEFAQEKEQESIGNYKRVDILKMHAYNDAIRRTGGSYVLYPGTEDKTLRGFHEIIPGLGAFSINPNSYDQDSKELKNFLKEILQHFLNRVSQRERKAFYDYEIHETAPTMLCEPMPEPFGEDRNLIPSDTNVIIAYYKDENQLNWIKYNKIYNARTGTQNGSLRLTKEITTAKYILLHSKPNYPQLLLRLNDKGARVISKENIIKNSSYNNLYTPKSSPYYIVFNIEKTEPEKEFINRNWNIIKLIKENYNQIGNQIAVPFGISMELLMKYVNK